MAEEQFCVRQIGRGQRRPQLVVGRCKAVDVAVKSHSNALDEVDKTTIRRFLEEGRDHMELQGWDSDEVVDERTGRVMGEVRFSVRTIVEKMDAV